jgi:hypothetical protein
MNMHQFQAELEALINKHSIENVADTPDFILARMIVAMIEAMGPCIKDNLDWHGANSVCHPIDPMALTGDGPQPATEPQPEDEPQPVQPNMTDREKIESVKALLGNIWLSSANNSNAACLISKFTEDHNMSACDVLDEVFKAKQSKKYSPTAVLVNRKFLEQVLSEKERLKHILTSTLAEIEALKLSVQGQIKPQG